MLLLLLLRRVGELVGIDVILHILLLLRSSDTHTAHKLVPRGIQVDTRRVVLSLSTCPSSCCSILLLLLLREIPRARTAEKDVTPIIEHRLREERKRGRRNVIHIRERRFWLLVLRILG